MTDAVFMILKREMYTTKSGIPLSSYLQDMKARGNGVLICNLGDSRESYALAPYILDRYGAEVEQGLEVLAELSGCTEMIRYQGISSAVLREPTALYAAVDGAEVIQCSPARQEYLSEYSTYGYHGRPTLVVSAEDCKMMADIIDGRKVTKIIAISIGEQTIYREAEVGTLLQNVTDSLEIHNEIKAWQLGNQMGTILTPQELKQQKVEYNWLYDTLQLIETESCMVNEIYQMAKLATEDSCQKCVICREGTWQTVQILKDVVEGKGRSTDLQELRELASLVSAGSMCSFGQNALRAMQRALGLFSEEFEEHIVNHSCRSGVCGISRNYQIDPALCKGCTDCVESCEYDAIEGKKGFIHMIDGKMCEKCGACLEECPQGAIKIGANLKVPNRLVKVGRYRG